MLVGGSFGGGGTVRIGEGRRRRKTLTPPDPKTQYSDYKNPASPPTSLPETPIPSPTYSYSHTSHSPVPHDSQTLQNPHNNAPE